MNELLARWGVREQMIGFFKYCVVGGIGTLIDVGVLYLLVERFSFSVLLATTIAFLLAVTHNFLLNKWWTFQNTSKNYRKLFLKFLLISVGGLGITMVSMWVLVYVVHVWYIFAKILTSVVVLVWNFLGNKLWTFRRRTPPAALDAPKRSLTIIIPAFNEEHRITSTLERVQAYVMKHHPDGEVLVVDDGSRDQTCQVVEMYSARFPELRLLALPENRGKGHAVKKGIEASTGKVVLFMDADLSTPIEELDAMLHLLEEHDVVIGSRYLEGSRVEKRQPRHRIWLSRLGNTVITLFLLDGVRDTQCGFKLFRGDVARTMVRFQRIHRFGFDMELLVILRSLGYRLVEAPVSWVNSTDSRLRPIKDALITFKDLIRIKLNVWMGRYSPD